MSREITATSKPGKRGRALLRIAVVPALTFLLLLAAAPSAPAATISNERPFLFSFNGEGTTAGAFTLPANLAVDYSCLEHEPPLDETTTPKCAEYDPANGAVYVLNRAGAYQASEGPMETTKRAIDKFHPDGSAWDFSALGKSSLDGSATPNGYFKALYLCAGCGLANDLAVDTSAVHPGRIYLGENGGPVYAFAPSGSYLWTFEPPGGSCGVTVDATGRLWVVTCSSSAPKALEFETTGSGAPSSTPLHEFSLRSGAFQEPAWAAIGRGGNAFYVGRGSGPGSCPERYVAEAFSSCLTSEFANEISLDQSSVGGHVFTVGFTKFREFDASAAEVAGSPFGHDLIGLDTGDYHGGDGIAYDPATGRVYVSDKASNTVKAFGPVTSGAAPNAAAGEATAVGKSQATINGTLNPQALPNSYHFEVKPLIDEFQRVSVKAVGGSFRLIYKGTVNSPIPASQETTPIPYSPPGVSCGSARPTAAEVRAALEALPGIGAGNVSVTGGRKCVPGSEPGTEVASESGGYGIAFQGALEATDIEQMKGNASELLNNGSPVELTVGTADQGVGNWGAARTVGPAGCTPPAPLPEDSTDHTVSCTVTGLEGNTRYQFRLVGTDTESHLSSYSPAKDFETLPPPSPTVSAPAVSVIATESAHIAATIDAKEAKTTWRVLLGAQPGTTTLPQCEALGESAFKTAKEGTIPLGETAPVKIEADLTGLLHAQSYCVRVTAENGNPKAGVADALFRTVAIAPTQVFTAFAAPTTDTGATLNGRVNPEGEVISYRFEYSSDGGETWKPVEGCKNGAGEATAQCVNAGEDRRQVVVGEQLSGLRPGTAYSYRFSAENPKGSLQGAALSFTTRTTAELSIPPNALGEPERRGIELVSSPEKGDQNAIANTAGSNRGPYWLSADGETALWTVLGGAPGGYNGTEATFLARRAAAGACPTGFPEAHSETGWCSKSLVPPPDRQVGGGRFSYLLETFTPDFSKFVFRAGAVNFFHEGEQSVLRLDQGWDQEVLKSWSPERLFNESAGLAAEVSDDGSHVIAVDARYVSLTSPAKQLVELGDGSGEVLSIMPDGSRSECGLDDEVGESFAGPGNNRAATQWRAGYDRIATTDASRVYFQAPPNGHCEYPGSSAKGPYGIYERNREAIGGAGQTTLIDPGASSTQAATDPALIRVTPNGREAYYVTRSRCRRWRQTGPPFSCEEREAADKNEDADVYRWDEETGESECLTCVVRDASVTGSTMVSDDFSHVYFESVNQLIPGEGRPAGGNLYVLAGSALRYVASPTGEVLAFNHAFGARLSSDGNVLVFESDVPLTADPVASQCLPIDAHNGSEPCHELYRYEDSTGSLECLSCVHGATTTRSVGFPLGLTLAATSPNFVLSADGSTVAFGTTQGLVRPDVNGGVDIYEWRNGVRRLITDGVTSFQHALSGPQLWGVDRNGQNILFGLAFPGLTGYERDNFANMYDARIGGGYPPPEAEAQCDVLSDKCQGPVPAAPFMGLPGSVLVLGGAGNASVPAQVKAKPKPKPKRCARGRVRRRVRGKARCVKPGHGARRGARRAK